MRFRYPHPSPPWAAARHLQQPDGPGGPGPRWPALPRHLPTGSWGWASSSEAEPGGLRLPWRWFPWREGKKGPGMKTQPGEGAVRPLKGAQNQAMGFHPTAPFFN